MSVNHRELMDSALRKATELADENLYAVLQLAEGDWQLGALLQPPPDPVRSEAGSPSDVGSVREVMCPDLYQAITSGSINRVNDLLGPLVETTHINAVNHDVEGRAHGEGFCRLQEVTAERNTVLHLAAEEGYLPLSEQIIQRDSTLLVSENSKQETPLHLAARAGNSSIVSLILLRAQESGIGAYEVLRKRSIEGDTVLHKAARHGHENVVQVLMTIAPGLSAEVNNASMSPLYLAVIKKSIGVVQTLLQYTHPSAVGPNEQNALHAAVLQSPKITSMLLDWKAKLANERDASGSTPVHYAASGGDYSVVEMILIKAPLSIYIQDEEGPSPLHVAAKMKHYHSLRSMVGYCPDSTEIRDNQGQNFLHILARHGGRLTNLRDHHYLKTLVNMRDNEGNTPLHCASMNGFSETVLDLLKIGEADASIMNDEGKTALDYAVSLDSFSRMAGIVVTMSVHGATFSPQRQDQLKYWKDETTNWINKTSKNLIVVSVLIATIAFSAAFNVPGTYSDDGLANLRQKRKYNIFLVLDTIAVSASVATTMLLVLSKADRNGDSLHIFKYSLIFLWTSLVTMVMAFVMAVTVVLGNDKPVTHFCISFFSFFFLSWTSNFFLSYGSPAKLIAMRKFHSSTKEDKQTARQVALQFPKLAFYVRGLTSFFFFSILLYIVMLLLQWKS